MEFQDLVRTRRSVRGYKPDPVPRAVIEEIIATAAGAPSSMNTQPWHVHVIAGELLDEVRRRNMEGMAAQEEPKRDIKTHDGYHGIHRHRQVEIAKKLFSAMEIDRYDKEKRHDWVLRGFRQFDAPVSLILTVDRDLASGVTCIFDTGALSYGLVLAAWDRGLGTVVNGQGISRSDIVREVCGIPDEEVIVTAIAMGYPNDEFAANHVKADRESVADIARFHGFGD